MIMRTMKQLYILILCAGCFSACDSFLEKTPQDEMIPETTTSFNELLWGEGYPAEGRAMDVVCSYLSDEYTSLYSSGRSDEALLYQNFYTWQPLAYEIALDAEEQGGYGMTGGMNCWENYYKRVLGCNIALKYADGSIGTDEDKERLKGEALVLRAFYYFQLVNYYALPYSNKDSLTNPGVPIVLSPDIVETGSPRNTVSEVYRQILSDLNEGIRLLEMRGRESAVYRLNALSAHLLASRVYLYMENWEKALEHARVVMGQKELCDYTQGVPTAIFTAENDDILWMYGTKDNVWGIGDANLSSSAFVASYSLYESFESEEWKDARADGFFSVARDSVFDSYYDYETGQVIKELISSSVMVSVLKYPTSTSAYMQGVRVTEAYLNAIEALLGQYKAGNSGAGNEALQLLNDFRSKRYVSAGGTAIPGIEMKNADELIDIYRLERRKELCYEGQRWFDLRRFGMPRLEKIWALDGNAREKYVLEKHDPLYVLEIPAYVTDLNSGLQLNETLSSPRLPVSL